MKLRIEVLFVPVPKARPRVHSKGTYLPPAYEKSRTDLAWLLVDARNKIKAWPMNKSYIVNYDVWLYRRNAGDADNLVGTLLDAGKRVLWDDDMQVIELHVRKHRGPPKVLIEVDVIEESTGFEPAERPSSGRYKNIAPKRDGSRQSG